MLCITSALTLLILYSSFHLWDDGDYDLFIIFSNAVLLFFLSFMPEIILFNYCCSGFLIILLNADIIFIFSLNISMLDVIGTSKSLFFILSDCFWPGLLTYSFCGLDTFSPYFSTFFDELFFLPCLVIYCRLGDGAFNNLSSRRWSCSWCSSTIFIVWDYVCFSILWVYYYELAIYEKSDSSISPWFG